MSAGKKARALSLLSGGLDSILAVKILEEQGIEVVGVTFVSPFFGAEKARHGAEKLGIELRVVDVTDEIMELVRRPRHGLGRQMNPCIDCHSLMVREAGRIMEREGFDFVATGEVLGERPMSQNRQSLDKVADSSGFGDRLLRPLSAKLLAPTRPEIEGTVDRERLLDIRGRSRRPQMALAKRYGITDYVQPAGGCLLTDPAFAARLRELLKMEPDATARDARLLSMGRHFRLPSGAKAIVGRDAKDNARIVGAAERCDALVISDRTPGPAVLVVHSAAECDIDTAARLCASYSDGRGARIDMALRRGGAETRISAVQKDRAEFDSMRID